MRKRSDVSKGDVSPKSATELVVTVDIVNEQVVITATIVALCSDDPTVGNRLLDRFPPETFTGERQEIWAALRSMRQKRLAYDPATLQSLAGDRVNVGQLAEWAASRPDIPENLDYHVEALQWDRKRSQAVKGPLTQLLEAIKNPQEAHERVLALARGVTDALSGHAQQYIYSPEAIVAESMSEIRKRLAGHATYPFGIDGLDYFDANLVDIFSQYRPKRMIPGAAPGQITVITGVPGSGKSTLAATMALGLGVRNHRRVGYGAWEMKSPMTLEIMACISLGWQRADLLDPDGALKRGKPITPELLVILEEKMHEIARWVTFIKNPFRRRSSARKSAKSNEENLDLVQSLISDSGCEVFIADLWARCLASREPSDEEEALFRQQAMLEEMNVHGILCHQQRHKDIEVRSDKRPTREGLKGSGAYLETADNLIGVHRPAQWRKVEDDKIEAIILKQRYGEWPLGVEFDWNAKTGEIKGGHAIEYDPMGEAAGRLEASFQRPNDSPGSGPPKGGRGRPRSGR
jgi:energy-coupling factor transporter ATP-binding protein EcfA2